MRSFCGDGGDQEGSVSEILLDGVEITAGLSPVLAAKLLDELIRLYYLGLFSKDLVVHELKHIEVYWEEDIGFSSFD